jgi:hypothetical protein
VERGPASIQARRETTPSDSGQVGQHGESVEQHAQHRQQLVHEQQLQAKPWPGDRDWDMDETRAAKPFILRSSRTHRDPMADALLPQRP